MWLEYRGEGGSKLSRSLRFKPSNGNSTIMSRRVAYHEALDLFFASLDIKKELKLVKINFIFSYEIA